LNWMPTNHNTHLWAAVSKPHLLHGPPFHNLQHLRKT
jgi:hypothetical protein